MSHNHKCLLCHEKFTCSITVGQSETLMSEICEGDYDSFCEPCQDNRFDEICYYLGINVN